LLNPATQMAGLGAANPATTMAGLSPANPAKSDPSTLPNRASNPANMLAGKKRNNEERRTAGRESISPNSASPVSKKDSRGKGRIRKKAQADPAESFEDFWAVYPRKVAKEAAARAYAAAIKRGVEPQTLIEGAKRYAVERKGQDPKYTKHPATWLHG